MVYQKYRRILLPVLLFPILIIIWELYIRIFEVPNYLLPRPLELAGSMVDLFATGGVGKHIIVTMKEILIGTVAGIAIGLVMGYIMAKIKFIERLIMPFVIIIQTAPKISLAPLFILWMGLGIESKVALVILVVSFPIMINQVSALRSIEENVYNLLHVFKATKLQIFMHVELPYSVEMLLSGVKLALTQAMTGAVIGEMIGAKAGLGYLLTLGSETYDIRMILNAVILLSAIGLTLYLLSEFVERKALYWKELDKSVIG
ncbi:NitT/TauT family transport system permease protein [Ruminiclostridium sufflavum DSM 19573]|uniref:NitT/TauT family transport system permease protein n=1 Tax=Ruminiclostridium sufflavum DSM 19573 TaxID=1121337 RepID=A0A318XTX9_9FIRM|nr:ABC transporter permease [Ruminiclostridium sufflavum]PYG90303.1 NitT/TauT family transport system permease protein [Ruminiclostridium sufflavum DSM 19573]